MFCVNCGNELGNEDVFCGKCGSKVLKNVEQERTEQQVKKIYKYTFWSGKVEVKCDRCGSYNCDFFKDRTQDVVKASYSLNLNPLKPFTPLNKKEKIVKKGQILDKYICKDCGRIFE